MKKDRTKNLFLDQLRKIPVVNVAADKSGVTRNSVYRWRREDEAFRKAMEEALAEGDANMMDMTEVQLYSLIRDKHFPAIHLYLRTHHPKFSNKVELSGSLKIESEPLTPEQQTIVDRALKLAGLTNSGEPIVEP